MSSLVQQPPRASDLPAWKLQEAKARFSALVREARAIGPQRVTLHGKDVVVVLAVEEFARLAGPAHRTGLHELLSQSPFADLDFEPEGVRAPVREVIL